MKITANGVSWNIEPSDIPKVAEYFREHQLQVVRGCQRCEAICCDVNLCECCKRFRNPAPGSPKAYTTDGKFHVAAMPAAEFIKRSKARAA